MTGRMYVRIVVRADEVMTCTEINELAEANPISGR